MEGTQSRAELEANLQEYRSQLKQVSADPRLEHHEPNSLMCSQHHNTASPQQAQHLGSGTRALLDSPEQRWVLTAQRLDFCPRVCVLLDIQVEELLLMGEGGNEEMQDMYNSLTEVRGATLCSPPAIRQLYHTPVPQLLLQIYLGCTLRLCHSRSSCSTYHTISLASDATRDRVT